VLELELLVLDDESEEEALLESLLFESLLFESLLFEALAAFLLEGPEYRSDSQPPPLRMKPPPPIIRRALSLPQLGHFLTGFSVMRCSRSNS
jgi:hypothetical protein